MIKTDFNACDTKKEMIATGRAINGLNGKSKNVPGQGQGGEGYSINKTAPEIQ